MPATTPRTRALTHRQRKALSERRIWTIIGLVAALVAPLLWYAALQAGYLAHPYHSGFEIIASLAFADTCLALFALFAWFDADTRADRAY